MPDPTTTVTPTSSLATVSFTVDEALMIAQALGGLASAVVPAEAPLIALVTGAANLLRNTIIPAIKNRQDHVETIAEQATLQAESAAERARVGAPQAVVN